MRDMLPLESYEKASSTSFWRPTLILAMLWAVPMTMFMLRTDQGGVGFVVAIGVIGGLIFGALLTMLTRFAIRQVMRQVYHGMWPLVPAAPSGQYDARLMCKLIRGRLAIGGHLYIGRECWAFVPHTRNGPLYRKPVRWGQPARLVVSTQPPRFGWLMRLFGATAGEQMVVAEGESKAVFVVPDAAHVASALEGFQK